MRICNHIGILVCNMWVIKFIDDFCHINGITEILQREFCYSIIIGLISSSNKFISIILKKIIEKHIFWYWCQLDNFLQGPSFFNFLSKNWLKSNLDILVSFLILKIIWQLKLRKSEHSWVKWKIQLWHRRILNSKTFSRFFLKSINIRLGNILDSFIIPFFIYITFVQTRRTIHSSSHKAIYLPKLFIHFFL